MKMLIAALAICGTVMAFTSVDAQQLLDRYIDEQGRQVLVDPYTGEVVRIIGPRGLDRDRRWQRRQERRARRAALRAERLERLERELERLLGGDDEFYSAEPRRPGPRRGRPQRPRQGFSLDEWEDRQRVWEDDRNPQAAPQEDDQFAALPAPEAKPLQPVKPAPGQTTKPALSRDLVTKLQIFLDREGFSPGVIDGAWGSNVAKAVKAWQDARGDRADLTNPLILEKYVSGSGFDPFQRYAITREDVRGPFVASIPVDYGEKARMPRMSFTSVAEMLAERFHMSEAHLKRLNPGTDFNTVGAIIRVVRPGEPKRTKVHYVVADKGAEQVRAYDRNGNLVAAYPATIGSTATPSPSGKVSIERIALNPNYTYNPKRNFKQGNNDRILTIPPGPNGPVGSVWIALSKPSYGIHGTPQPELIGKTNSNGCIRLTNWDAEELASLVSEGVTVEFTE